MREAAQKNWGYVVGLVSEESRPLDDEGSEERVKAITPYAGGGGGSTFAHYVAATYIARMLLGEGRIETDELPVTQVHFQVPGRHVDDLLIVGGADGDNVQVLVAARRSPSFVRSHAKTRELVATLVRQVQTVGDDDLIRVAVAVADWTDAFKQVQELAILARHNLYDEESFHRQVHVPGRRNEPLRRRYRHLFDLVTASRPSPLSESEIRLLTWRLLRSLWVLEFRVEVANEADWSATASALNRIARPPYSGAHLRDRLFTLCAKWDLLGVEVDELVARRHLRTLLGDHSRPSNRFWAALDDAESYAFCSVRSTIGVATDDAPPVRIERAVLPTELGVALLAAGTGGDALVVAGESGTGKSSLVLSTVRQLASRDPDRVAAVVVNLRHLTDAVGEMRSLLRKAIIDTLRDSSVDARIVVVDAADAVLEHGSATFGEVIRDVRAANAGLVVVSADTAVSQVRDQISTLFGAVNTFDIPPLNDEEIAQVTGKVPLLSGLLRNLPQRSLLRRLVVLDLLVRARITVDGSLTGWDCLEIVWRGLVRRNENSDFGSSEGRERALLTLAERELGLPATSHPGVADPSAVDALRRDHLLAPFNIYDRQPRFAHDEIRRYAVALVLFRSGSIGQSLKDAGVPRWAMSAAQLACQGSLLHGGTPPSAAFKTVEQEFFDIGARFGSRWADVPVEAALESPRAYEHLRGLPLTSSSNSVHGLHDIVRVVEQRQSVDGLIDIDRGEPVVRVLLEHDRSWQQSEPIFVFVAAWLRSLIAAETPVGHPTRQLLRSRLIDYWQEHYEPPSEAVTAEQSDRADRWSDRAGHKRNRRRRRHYLDYRLTDAKLIELSAALGADIGVHVQQILTEISEYAPADLAPAVDSPWSARAVAQHNTDLLHVLMERYYIDLEADGGGIREDGVRRHCGRWLPLGPPFAAYWFGGFWQLFVRIRLNRSASLLNKILNHAARYRAEDHDHFTSATTSKESRTRDSSYFMSLSGRERCYVGDASVWNWYRGSTVGPYPCMSALQAMERLLDQCLKADVPMQAIVHILLEDCENLAVPALLLGVMIRHIEVSKDAIEPFLVEPLVWVLDSGRVTHEHFDVHAPDSDQLVHSERRRTTLREVCMGMVLSGDEDRRGRLRALGHQLADKGNAIGMGTEAAGWAACLNSDRFRRYRLGDQVVVEVEPPEQVAQWHTQWRPDQERTNTILRLQNRYAAFSRRVGEDYSSPTADEISADLGVVEDLLKSPPSMAGTDPADAAAHVASTAIQYVADGIDPVLGSGLAFAINLVMSVISAFEDGADCSHEDEYFALAADRAAATALPLLLLPKLSYGLADAGFAVADVDRAALALTRKGSLETRLYLARGCDRLWSSPCHETPCFHDIAFRWLTDTARDAEIGPWDSEGQTRAQVRITSDLIDRLAELDDDSIAPDELDAAIRCFGAASASSSCVARQAITQLDVLLHAHRRAMVVQGKEGWSVDHNQYQSLVAARALAQVATVTGIDSLTAHLTGLRGNAHLLANFLHMFAAVGAETSELGRSVRTAWPVLVEHALTLSVGTPNPYADYTWGDWALAALMPRPAGWTDGLYNEIETQPFDWVVADDLIDVIPRWVRLAIGHQRCVDNFVSLLHRFSPRQQAALGLQWVQELCVQNNQVSVHSSPVLNEWVIGLYQDAEAHGQLPNWQKLVDQLVAAGNRQLAPYSV